MAIDRADWHFESAEKLYRETHSITGELTEKQEEEISLLAAQHIGLFLRWIIERGFEGDDSDKEECEKVRSGQLSGAEYLLKNCDGKLWDEDIREDILPFAESYYGNGNDYLDDYYDCCTNDDDKPLYGVKCSEADYLRLKDKIDKAYEKFTYEQTAAREEPQTTVHRSQPAEKNGIWGKILNKLKGK